MASITIRNLDEAVKRKLRLRAAQRNRSMEDEARDILRAAVAEASAPPGNLADLIRQCTQLARSRYHLDEHSLRYEENLNGERPMVLGDAEELRAVMANLLDNAIKYSFQDVRVHVEVSATDDRQVLVKVRDSGLGIPGDQLKRVFRRFYRVPGRDLARVKGTGLGLFIVRSGIKKHGGRVRAESAGEGQGSTFTIQLPTT